MVSQFCEVRTKLKMEITWLMVEVSGWDSIVTKNKPNQTTSRILSSNSNPTQVLLTRPKSFAFNFWSIIFFLILFFRLSSDSAMMSDDVWVIFYKKQRKASKEEFASFQYILLCTKHTIFLSFCNDLLFVKRKTKTKRLLILYMPHNNYLKINSNRAWIVCWMSIEK